MLMYLLWDMMVKDDAQSSISHRLLKSTEFPLEVIAEILQILAL